MLDIGKISVGPPVFAVMFLVPMLPLMVFLAVGMHSAWRRGRLTAAAKPSGWLLLVAAGLSLLVQGVGFGSVPLGGARRLRVRFLDHVLGGLEPVQRWRRGQKLTAGLLGMAIAHIGVGMFAIGASGVESYKIEKDVALKPGETYSIAGYDFRFVGAADVTRTELRCGRGDGRGHPGRKARDHAPAAEAPFLGTADR